MKIRALFLFLLLAVSNGCSLGQVNTQTAINNFQKQLADDVSKDGLHGSISALVMKDNKVAWAGAVGYARVGGDIPADTSNIYRIGSITKVFTATLLMMLVEDGKVKLDDLAETYVPEVKQLHGYSKDPRFTLRQLASHTAGLKREPDVRDADEGATDDWEKKLLYCIPHTAFNSKPGEGFLYSNMGFAILGLALERAAGMPYMQMVQQRIFIPLHMNDTYFKLPDDKMARLAQGTDNNANGDRDIILPIKQIPGRGYRVPNGAIFSTPKDLAKFALSFLGKPYLLKPESLREMHRVPPGGKGYGLGLILSGDTFGHDGSVPGYTAEMAIDPKTGSVVILMRSYNFGATKLPATARDLLKRL